MRRAQEVVYDGGHEHRLAGTAEPGHGQPDGSVEQEIGQGVHPMSFIGRIRRAAGESLMPDREIRMFEFRSEEHTSELQSLMRISYAVFCLKKKKQHHRI